MGDLLKQAFEKAMTLPVDQQDAAGAALLDYLDDARSLQLTDEQVAEVRRRLSDPSRGLLSVEDVKDRLGRLG
ncbi:hypothetical protein [Pseudorhodoplanes sp.]|uniref:hypothetical protein n=1 Tax=Pseudorhodoplanes sp. TaxID=1934341 RepID=UPI00391DB00E